MPLRLLIRTVVLACMLFSAAGCAVYSEVINARERFPLITASRLVRGIIYTDIRYPLTTNMEATPSGEATATSSYFNVSEPVTRARITAEWDSWAIGDAARQGKLRRMHFADLHVRSYLGGLWSTQTVEVWGEKEVEVVKDVTP